MKRTSPASLFKLGTSLTVQYDDTFFRGGACRVHQVFAVRAERWVGDVFKLRSFCAIHDHDPFVWASLGLVGKVLAIGTETSPAEIVGKIEGPYTFGLAL